MTTDNAEKQEKDDLCQSNVFVMDADGFKVHFQINAPGTKILTRTNTLLTALKERKFKPDTSMERGRGGGRPPKAPPVVKANGRSIAVKCGDCGSDVYDNRSENDQREARGERRRPDFKCKKCEWICWDAEMLLNEPSDEAYEPDAVPFE